ncbi:hypothetical protein [Frisingicoccus sp.]|uniref:hypothetical protein n=1 Tax=Frisingicoccus sp. TaxID=1918627 RepID=UPI003AB25287
MRINVTFDSIEEMKSFVGYMEGASVHIESKAVTALAQAVTEPADTVVQDPPVNQPVQSAFVQPAAPTVSAPVQTTSATAVPAQTTVPTSPTAYALDDLARAGMMLMDSGRQADLQQILVQFGVTSLPELPKEQYGAFATALRGLGAQI